MGRETRCHVQPEDLRLTEGVENLSLIMCSLFLMSSYVYQLVSIILCIITNLHSCTILQF